MGEKGINWIMSLRDAGGVHRLHTERNIPGYSVAEHSWGAIPILLDIVAQPSKELILTVLFHDAGEYETGDVPAPAKWNNRQLREALEEIEQQSLAYLGLLWPLEEWEQKIVRCVDYLELAFYCYDQRVCGHMMADHVVEKISKKMNFNSTDFEEYWGEDYLEYGRNIKRLWWDFCMMYRSIGGYVAV